MLFKTKNSPLIVGALVGLILAIVNNFILEDKISIVYLMLIFAVPFLTLLVLVQVYNQLNYIKILTKNCDPEVFLKEVQKSLKKFEKNMDIKQGFLIQESAGYIALGQYEKAKDVLLSVDKKYLKGAFKKTIKHAYNINLVSCLYELDEFENAEEVYKNELLNEKVTSKNILQSLKLLEAERLFKLKKYDECKKLLKDLDSGKNEANRLSKIYILAKIHELHHEIESAIMKYKEVSEKGNKLWIVQDSKEKLNKLTELKME